MRHVRAFGAFWYDFLVGDRWELFLGPLAALLLVRVLVWAGLPGAVTSIVLFLLVAGTGALSVGWILRQVRRGSA